MTELQILLIEDDDLLRKALFAQIQEWGHSVEACNCLTEARKILSGGSFDVVLLDMRLPDGDGIEFLSAQKAEYPAVDFVIMTAYADVRTAVEAIKHGAFDYLSKPFENEQLQKIIRNAGSKVELTRRVSSLSQLTISSHNDVWCFDKMIGTDTMKKIFEKAERIAGFSDTTVLLLGESGTGKGMLAKTIHRLSKRADKPFVDINCSALPAQLIESELFGYEKGAFTDAKNNKPGLLEAADGGTVFLDEIGDMEINLQSKLLKVIEDKEFRRLGGGKIINVNVRIVAATSRNLKELIAAGKFREDLYYRLSVVPIVLPPLRDHQSSIAPISDYYRERLAKEMGRTIKGFTKTAMEALMKYSWPGNVRELRNAVERGVILTNGDEIDLEELGIHESLSEKKISSSAAGVSAEFKPMSLADSEKNLIQSVLSFAEGNKNKAADILKIHRTTLYKKLQEYGLE
ncbi:MAG: hypothetical protein A2283_07145 [Lentisphaerae bacterium RIFOXYA12_FULL_48_11]|nr:MAG: hypothetical protein A2283_07145 [Lentisphaerae bacterium RIFOXYA12_FULL_48_11]